VIAVFTKFDQFKADIEMKLEDEGLDSKRLLNDELERVFNRHYLAAAGDFPSFIRLESEGIYQLLLITLIPVPRRNA
jgi:hypothetical protein